ncbi:tenascin-N-like isoform X2 [Strongylocentrotus purpuratus]|uniref:Uncharacterized protein n=1 Tax=Strongylocentrotus purpuratus TaxID=7668 RepID=A0A7M7NR49_STRPU|nr:tenascin-N-like isoform X2 [Strongylocentrotus purpuratus]
MVEVVSSNRPAGNQYQIGATPLTFTFADPSGNVASCSYNVNVVAVDTIPPVVSCPPTITITASAGETSAQVSVPSATATDNSGIVIPESTDPPSTFPLGATSVTYTFSDPSGNRASCTFDVIVLGGTPATNVVVDSTTQDSITLSWASVPSSLIYQIVYNDPSGTQSQTTTTETTTLTNLLEGTTYNITVLSFTSAGQTEVGSVTATTSMATSTTACSSGPCQNLGTCFIISNGFTCICPGGFTGTQCELRIPATNVLVDSITQDSITLSWPAVPSNLIYQIVYNGPTGTQSQTTTSETTTLTGLLEGTAYNITVLSFTSTGQTEVGSVAATTSMATSTTACSSGPCQNLGTCLNISNGFTCICPGGFTGTQCELRIPATNVLIDSITQDSITLSWPAVPSNLIYQIVYNGSSGTQSQTTTTETTTLTNLLEGTTYNITVLSFTSEGQTEVGSVTATTSMATSTTACSSGPCQNLGTCLNISNGFTCICPGGFTGTQCELTIATSTAVCSSGPCQNLGTCVAISNVFTCICREGFTGTQCELIPLGTSLDVSDLGTDFITLTWENDPSQNIVSYVLTLFDETGTTEVFPEQPLAPEPTLTYQFTGLQPGTKYTVDVDVIVGLIRNQFALEMFYTRPKPPENIILYTLSNAISFLRWDPPSSPDNYFEGYRVAYQDLSPGPVVQTALPSAVGSHVIDGLQDGVAYDFTVLTTIGQTTTSLFAEFPIITLGSSANVSVGAVTARELEVYWTIPQVYAQSYVVHLFNEGGTEEHTRTAGVENMSVVFQNLTADTVYVAIVETVSASSQLSYVVGWDLAKTNVLSGSTVSVVNTDSTTATLSWAAVPTATGYVISYISQDVGDTGTFTLSSPTTTATVPDLQSGTTYTFAVVAATTPLTNVGTAVGTTTFSSEVLVDEVTFNAIRLSWTNIPDSFFYQVAYRDQNGPGGQFGSITNTAIIEGLASSTAYNITVLAFTSAGQVEVGSVTVLTEIESTVAVISRTTDTIVLTWDPLPGALVYTINYTDGVSSNVGQSFDSFATISGLMHNTTYEFSVRGFGQSGEVNLGSASTLTAPDTCASSPCLNGGQCLNDFSSFSCQCDVGYLGAFCETAIQCVIPPMPDALNSFDGLCNGPSIIDFGHSCTYRCDLGFIIRGQTTLSCQPNGTLDGTFPTCEDLNECSNGLMCEDPNSFCLNNVGSFMCVCNGGFQLMPDGTCQASTTIACTADLCQNGGTCLADVNRLTCACPVGFTGPVCEIDLSCGGVSCGSSQVCVNEQCTCLDGFILEAGLCQSSCSPSCDFVTEICLETLRGFECHCRPERERSFWTGLCILRSRAFVSVFTIDELSGSPVDFNPSFADPTSLAFQNGSDAVTGLLPLAFESGGMPGVISVDVGGFFQGSLMCEIIVYVGQDFHGSESDLKKVLQPNETSPRFADDTRELLIRRNSVTVHEITTINLCEAPELNDCSVNAVCMDGDGIGYICMCMEGYMDIFPESLPGRYCVEDTYSTNAPGTDQVPGTGLDKRSLFIGLVSSVAIVILLVVTVFCFNLIRIHREEYKVKRRAAAPEHNLDVKPPEGCVQSSVPDVFFKKSSPADHTYINANPQLDQQYPSNFNLEASNCTMVMDILQAEEDGN